MNLFFRNMRPWWWGFLISWVVVAFVLRGSGMEGTAAARLALIAGATSALVIWLVYRARERFRRG